MQPDMETQRSEVVLPPPLLSSPLSLISLSPIFLLVSGSFFHSPSWKTRVHFYNNQLRRKTNHQDDRPSPPLSVFKSHLVNLSALHPLLPPLKPWQPVLTMYQGRKPRTQAAISTTPITSGRITSMQSIESILSGCGASSKPSLTVIRKGP